MTIGILYESKEWSTFALRDHITTMVADCVGKGDTPVRLIDLQEDLDPDELLSCSLIISRVFASAVFRGHQKALDQMPKVIEILEKNGVPMINPAEAHYYETSKKLAKETLAANGFPVPELYGCFCPARNPESVKNPGIEHAYDKGAFPGSSSSLSEKTKEPSPCPFVHASLKYPCIVKPDCGGRTTHTFIVKGRAELIEAMKEAPDVLFLAEEYILPEKGYVTRLEIIDGKVRLALKRGVVANGLSAYHLGSKYEFYPELPDEIADTAIRAMGLLKIEAGSMDVIENEAGYYIIDVNSVSNASEDNTEMFDFDLMKETAAYAAKRYSACATIDL